MNKRKRLRNNNNNNDDNNGFADWGGYMEAKKSKLVQQYHESTKNEEIKQISNIFNGVQLLVNGLTNPNSDEIKKLMQQHGGIYQIYQNSSTTHIIASNLPNVKINKLGTIPIVKPSWITESIELGKLLDYRRYLLYTNQTVTQPRLNFPIIPQQPQQQKIKTASDPNFVEEFYQNSRLHLIATLGTEYKELITKKRQENNYNFPKLQELIRKNQQNNETTKQQTYQYPIIMHIDMDCFFVSVGIRNRPELKDLPVAVTHARNPNQQQQHNNNDEKIINNLDRSLMDDELIDKNSSLSEIASCNYIARKYGIRNGMFLGAAIKLCPNLITIPYNFDDYRQVSNILYNTLIDYTLDIEAVSCDEMYVDCSEILKKTQLTIEQWSKCIRNEILIKTKCTCSTGFGNNRLLARLATKHAKPSNWFYIEPNHVQEYMRTIPINELPGVGYATITKLNRFNIKTCGDLLEKITNNTLSLDVLKQQLGQKFGEQLYKQVQGIDSSTLNYNYERKSISAEINYGIRFENLDDLQQFLENLTKEVCQRLNDINMKTKFIQLKLLIRAKEAPIQTAKFLGHGICDIANKTIKLNQAINDPVIILKHIKELYQRINPVLSDLRGIGIHLSKLEKSGDCGNNLRTFLQKLPCTSSGGGGGNNKTIDKFFKSKRQSSQNLSRKHDIDYGVLAELPQDIREEIVKEYQLNINTNQVNKVVKIEEEKSPFLNLQLHEIRLILTDWLHKELIPKQYDIMMLIDYFQQLINNYNIELLIIIMRFLYRNLIKLNCQWHHAYKEIYNRIQDRFILIYGYRLKIQRNYQCCTI